MLSNREQVAAAIWEVWRLSELATITYRDLTWEKLNQLQAENPNAMAPKLMIEVALREADAAMAILTAQPPSSA